MLTIFNVDKNLKFEMMSMNVFILYCWFVSGEKSKIYAHGNKPGWYDYASPDSAQAN